MEKKLIDHVFAETTRYLEDIPKTKRKAIGQFFTSVETAEFMANLFRLPKKKEISILDPGAGSGILSAALIERLEDDDNVKSISLTCYETNPDILPLLKKSLEFLKDRSSKKIEYLIIEDNYLTSQNFIGTHSFFDMEENKQYDLIIGNPPYKKIQKNAPETAKMKSICYGAPNLYSLFAAMSLYNLSNSGEMVYIIPRSWTSGAYFSRFREYFLSEGTLEHIHLFNSRNKIFESEDVLQETMIIKMSKTGYKKTIVITSTHSNNDFHEIKKIEIPYNTVVCGSENYVFLVTEQEDLEILGKINRFKDTLLTLGLKMRTGLTVDFRSSEYLSDKDRGGVVPLFYPQHIQNGSIIFPLHKKDEYISNKQSGLMQKNKNYLFVKRFSSKEEKRRLQCGRYFSSDFPGYSHISTDNKLNFIEGVKDEMPIDIVNGLYAVLNSTFYDAYYRILNGSTQVNSTELNSIPFPTYNQILRLGQELFRGNDFSVKSCDKLIKELFHVMSKIEEARFFLESIGMPKSQQTDLCCYSLLALAQITPEKPWEEASNEWIRIHDIIQFTATNYDLYYAENSRETFRKQAIHHFRNAALIEDNGRATNSPHYKYRITSEALHLIQQIGLSSWQENLKKFRHNHISLIDLYSSKKVMEKHDVLINGDELKFSPGKHNILQKMIIEDFAPRFAPNSECLYVGDTIKKDLVKNEDKLTELGFQITLHDKMPDVVLYREDKDWLYFIESVTSVGPMDAKRILEINSLTERVKSGKIFVTAFLDFETYKRFSSSIAWETEVWIANMPDHMLHMNGDKFLGPR